MRCCDHIGCELPGEYRAPKSRDRLQDYHWFCLEHVRDYNKTWNYYANMSPEEVEQETRWDTAWQRPTWPLGMRSAKRFRHLSDVEEIRDDFGLFGGAGESRTQRGAQAQAGFRRDTPEARALATIGLEAPLTLTRLKARYKELVKQHHPDANGGDRHAEERLKGINEAYAILRKALKQ